MKRTKGFTLTELMIAIAIIGLLVAAGLTIFDIARKKGRDLKRISDVKQVQQAIENYFNDCYDFPDDLSELQNQSPSGCYQPVLISIPDGIQYYKSTDVDDPKQYHLCTTLEISYGSNSGKAGMEQMSGVDPCDGSESNPDGEYVFDVVGGSY